MEQTSKTGTDVFVARVIDSFYKQCRDDVNLSVASGETTGDRRALTHISHVFSLPRPERDAQDIESLMENMHSEIAAYLWKVLGTKGFQSVGIRIVKIGLPFLEVTGRVSFYVDAFFTVKSDKN